MTSLLDLLMSVAWAQKKGLVIPVGTAPDGAEMALSLKDITELKAVVYGAVAWWAIQQLIALMKWIFFNKNDALEKNTKEIIDLKNILTTYIAQNDRRMHHMEEVQKEIKQDIKDIEARI